MRAFTILAAFICFSIASHAQLSKQVVKIYEENKYKEVITIALRVNDYLQHNDEKVICDMAGRSYYALQKYDSAIYFENRAISLDNDASGTSGWAYLYRGMAQYRLDKKQESIADLQKCLQLDKGRDITELAKEFLDEVNTGSVPPDDKYAYCFSQKEYKNTITEGRRLLQQKEYKYVLETVGAAYDGIHFYDSAIYFEHKALAVDKDATWVSAWAHVNLAIALFNTNEKEKAIEELRKTIQLDKTSNSVRKAEDYLDAIMNGRWIVIDSTHQVIKDQLKSDNYRTAASAALTSLATDPANATTWDQLTIAYCSLHNYDSSLYCGQKALEYDKGQSIISCETHYYMGIDRFMKSDKQGADAEFAAAITDQVNDNLRKKVKRIRTLFGLNDTYDRWKTIETANIIFHFQNKKGIDDVDAFMDKYEKEYGKASSILPAPPPKKIDLFVWERESLARNPLQNENDVATTNATYCLAHVADNNNRSEPIMRILGYWQRTNKD